MRTLLFSEFQTFPDLFVELKKYDRIIAISRVASTAKPIPTEAIYYAATAKTEAPFTPKYQAEPKFKGKFRKGNYYFCKDKAHQLENCKLFLDLKAKQLTSTTMKETAHTALDTMFVASEHAATGSPPNQTSFILLSTSHVCTYNRKWNQSQSDSRRRCSLDCVQCGCTTIDLQLFQESSKQTMIFAKLTM